MNDSSRGVKLVTCAAILMLRCYGSALAADGAGMSLFQFLQMGVGARPSAMGDVYAGVADDVNSIYWNPAGLAGIERRELSLTHALWLENITYSNVACAQRVNGGTVGVAFNALNTGDIPKADNTGAQLSEVYSMVDTMGMLSYARGWGNLALGANVKYISSRIEEEYAHSYAADLGVLYDGVLLLQRKFKVGLSVQNIGAKAKYVSEEDGLPVLVRAGWSLAVSDSLLIASDLNYTEKTLNVHAGAEYTRAFGSLVLAARTGYRNDTIKEFGALSGFSAGLGVKWNDYQLDYAWNSFTELGSVHRISIGIKFGLPPVSAVNNPV